MTDRPHQLKILLSPEEKRWLDQIVAHRDLTASDVVRQYIRQLVTTESVLVGYRVRTTDGTCVTRRGPHSVIATVAKPAPVSRADAYRIAADWLEAGYIPLVRRVMRRPT